MWHLVDHWSGEQSSFERHGHNAAWPRHLIRALEPTLTRHGIPPAAPGQLGPGAVWCSHVQQVQVRGQDIEDPKTGCTDLWVEVNPDRETISVHIEGIDLLRFVRDQEDPEPLPLADDLEPSLAIVARHLDSLCGAVIVILG